MDFAPEGYFKHDLLFVKSSWICDLLESQALPEEFLQHPNYTESEVTAILRDGKVPKVDQNDWEDITMLEYNGIDYIYVSDTGNKWDGHCRGTDNYEDKRVYRFPEPDWSQVRYGLK